MRILPFVFLLLMGMTWRPVKPTCVLETDFGLSINCGLKKSGMFRVRNLGGLKGYVGLGIQLADELGFKESLSALEQNSKRRSVNGLPVPGSFEPLGSPQIPQNNNNIASNSLADDGNNQDRSAYAKMNGRAMGSKPPVVVPPFRPLIAATTNVVRNVRLAAQQQSSTQLPLKPLPVPAFAVLPESIAKVAVEQPPQSPSPAGHKQPTAAVRPPGQLMTQPVPPSAFASLHHSSSHQPHNQHNQHNQQQQQHQQHQQQYLQQHHQHQQQHQPQHQQQHKQHQQQQEHRMSPVDYHNYMQQTANRRFHGYMPGQNTLDGQPIVVMPMDDEKKQSEISPLSNEVDSSSMMSLFNVASANNVSLEQLALTLRHQQQQRLSAAATTPFYSMTAKSLATTTPTPTTTTTTTTTPRPPTTTEYVPPPVTRRITIKPYKTKYGANHKVMNAPKEYYPVGYDKNFDDNFNSKVDLPATSFSCGDQKHFPGLYGDEDLGCMVFHVCAFTDDGLTQKSFLCPESTLFDQTILKCNWWFYVDCKSSKKLYDSNIPVSKSYQLMKALTFFSSYAAGPTVDASVAAATAAVSQPDDDYGFSKPESGVSKSDGGGHSKSDGGGHSKSDVGFPMSDDGALKFDEEYVVPKTSNGGYPKSSGNGSPASRVGSTNSGNSTPKSSPVFDDIVSALSAQTTESPGTTQKVATVTPESVGGLDNVEELDS